ncbi:MAG TPA: helix-turn-helix domain-containing protein [Patescibacteria group bacterium]|nr:helix-turn-helix domain-containing protein [Patescibacteria group bacterium]
MNNQLLTTSQASAILKVNINTVGQYLREGRIDGVKQGNTWKIHSNSLYAFLNRNRRSDRRICRNSFFFQEKLSDIIF